VAVGRHLAVLELAVIERLLGFRSLLVQHTQLQLVRVDLVVFQTPVAERQEAHHRSHQLVLLVVVKAVLIQPITLQLAGLVVVVEHQLAQQQARLEILVVTVLLKVMRVVEMVVLLLARIPLVAAADQVQLVLMLLAHQLVVMAAQEQQTQLLGLL
jgi:hypothetical protein